MNIKDVKILFKKNLIKNNPQQYTDIYNFNFNVAQKLNWHAVFLDADIA